MLSGNPTLSPNRIKFELMSTARAYPGADVMAQGSGLVDGYAAMYSAPLGLANQSLIYGNGSGSLEASRGTVHVDLAGVDGSVTTVNGNTNASLAVYSPLALLTSAAGPATWFASPWNGQSWTGQSWTGQSWTGQSWTGQSWTGQSWTGQSWTGQSWTGQSWTGQSWTGSAWYGAWDQ
jgi:serine protease AprX